MLYGFALLSLVTKILIFDLLNIIQPTSAENVLMS